MATGRLGAGDTAIQPTILDAKGDLIVATAADTPARLAVGSANQVLTVDSSTATGLKWATPAAGGKVLQVVYGSTSTVTVVASTTFTDTGLSATITPTATSSKVLILVSQMYYVSRTERDIGHALRILRNSTTVFTQDSDYNSGYIYTGGSGGLDVGLGAAAALNYLDSPNTTSAITYKTQGKANTTTNNGRVTYQEGSGESTIILLEIGA